jgi:predicted metal-dependent HD superfamily phosphohydrolase
MSEKNIVQKADKYVFELFKNSSNTNLIFHDYKHTADVAKAAIEIGTGVELNADDLEIVTLAAWFHDVGYIDICQGHEQISREIAEQFLESENYNPTKLQRVLDCILATDLTKKPENLLQDVLCDADTLNVGTSDYSLRSKLLRAEQEQITGVLVPELDWVISELDFLKNHHFYTRYAQLAYNEPKAKNIFQRHEEYKKQIKKQEIQTLKISEKEEKNIRNKVPQRGIETMFRTTLRNHINLSAIADSKANLMLSINAIIISITISALIPNYRSNPELIAPSVFLLSVCLLSIIFATLSTMPKVTRGVFTREDVKNKKANLLFFGNFFNNTLEDFQWGMGEMMKDHDFLYGSMIRDLHSLGNVLNTKYRFLRLTYYIFMFGMILSVIFFGLSIIFYN